MQCGRQSVGVRAGRLGPRGCRQYLAWPLTIQPRPGAKGSQHFRLLFFEQEVIYRATTDRIQVDEVVVIVVVL
ncbi:hypothetical protein BVG81_005905 [Haliangium sp. UPWRP_2]|nr:hypothetical protein BVG81_005905 [Haliangium sp. UPWRP_2]